MRSRREANSPASFNPFGYAEAGANLLANLKLDPFGTSLEFDFWAAKVEPGPIAYEAAE